MALLLIGALIGFAGTTVMIKIATWWWDGQGKAIPFDVDVERRRLNRLMHADRQQRQASIDGLEAALNAFDSARTSGLIDENARGDREGTGQR